METDELKVQWPFEVCQYALTGRRCAGLGPRDAAGTDGAVDYGRPLFIPDDYNATLMATRTPRALPAP